MKLKTKISADLLPVWLEEGERVTIQRGDFLVVVGGVVHGVLHAEDAPKNGFPLLTAPEPEAPAPKAKAAPVAPVRNEPNCTPVEQDIINAIRMLARADEPATTMRIGDELEIPRADKAARQLLSQIIGTLKKRGVIRATSDSRMPGYINYEEEGTNEE